MTITNSIAYQTLQAHVFRMIYNNMLPSEQRCNLVHTEENTLFVEYE